MKMRSKGGKGKGKVHPHSPSPSPSILPAAVLTLLSALSPDDRHVLAYILSTSLNSHLHFPNIPLCSDTHSPNFHCHCFRCYTAFWLRWDSSPNRDLIHRAIEAFEDHLANGEDQFNTTKPRKKDKLTRRKLETPISVVAVAGGLGGVLDFLNQAEANDAAPAEVADADVTKIADEDTPAKEEEPNAAEALPLPAAAHCNHKGLARKVLPDVMGIFNSRLWSLWSPNV